MRAAAPSVGSPSGRAAVTALLSIAFLGCGTECGPSYPAGTRLRVTVQEAFDDCQVTFDKGQTYDLVALPPSQIGRGDGASCEGNFAEGLPGFTTSEYDVERCASGQGPMSVECSVTLPTCAHLSPTARSLIRAGYSARPEEPGETVSSTLSLTFAMREGCESCSARIPVTIRW